MRLVFVIDTLTGGGAEKVVITLASTIKQLGHDALIVSLSKEVAYELPANVEVAYALEPARILGNLGRLRRHGKVLQKTLDDINQRMPINLVISNLPRTDRIVKHCSGYQRVFCIHNNYSRVFIARKKGFGRWLKLTKLKQTYRGESIVAVSEGVRKDIVDVLQLPVSASRTIYNPFEIDAIRALAAKPATQDYGDYIIHIGASSRQKRHDRLVRAYKLSGIANRVKLVLLGMKCEHDRNNIEALIQEQGLEGRVFLPPFEKNPFPLIKAAKALALSSDYEGFGNVLVEALICGVPVVSTNSPSGPSEIMTGNLAKYLVPVEDESALAAAIDAVCVDHIPIDESVYQRFAAETIAQQYLDLVQVT